MIDHVTYTYFFDNIKVKTISGDFDTGRVSVIRSIDPNGRTEAGDVEFASLPLELEDMEDQIIDLICDAPEEELEGESELIVSIDL